MPGAGDMAKKKRTTTTSRLQQRPKGRPPGWVWFVSAVFVVSVIVVVLMPQCQSDPPLSPPPPHSGPNLTGKFVREGVLTFYPSEAAAAGSADSVTIEIEIADDPASRQVGMMYRESMRPDQGMLFIFEENRIQSFWMHNTPLSLDMIFVGKDSSIVTIHQHTTPYSKRSYMSSAPAPYVIEVVAGFCKKHGIAVGDRVSWRRD